ncbi:hypothetical protein D3C76_1267570 [compost metagenome]
MQQGGFTGVGGEVVAVLDPDIDVRDTQQREQSANVEPDQVDRRKDKSPDDHGRQQYRYQCRNNAIDASLIKTLQRERIALDLGKNLGGDQETGDDKENVNANETPWQQADVEVMQKYRYHRHSPQPINVGAILALSHVPDHP